MARSPEARGVARNAPKSLAAALDESLDDLRTDPDLRRAIIAAYARMETALAAAGIPRHPAEAPLEYVERALLSLDTSAEAVRRLTDLFEWARFSHHEPEPSMRDDAVDALVAVRDELRASDLADSGVRLAGRLVRTGLVAIVVLVVLLAIPKPLDGARARDLGRARRRRSSSPRLIRHRREIRWAGACEPLRAGATRAEAGRLASRRSSCGWSGSSCSGARTRITRTAGSCRSSGTTAAARIAARHGFELERRPEAAAALLGEDAWELLRPDRPAPEDRHGPGVPRERVAAVIERVESL